MAIRGGKTQKKKCKPAARQQTARKGTLTPARLKRMIANLMHQLENEQNTNKASVSELLKLLQVYKELTAEQVREVEVRWVDRLRRDDESGT